MRSRPLSLGLLLLGGACSQIIGLSGYENTDAVGGTGSSSGAATGGTGNRGGANTGGSVSNPGGGEAGTAAAGGVGGEPAGGSAGEPSGGVGGSSGSPGDARGGGDAGSAGNGASGGSPTGGTAGRGGSGGTFAGGNGGAANGGTGKGGTGGAGTGGGGKGGSATGGSTTGGTTTGGTGGGGCIIQDLLLGQNPNLDDSIASPPEPAPWTSFSTDDLAVVNEQLYLTNAGVTAHTPGNAAWLGGLGNTHTFTDGSLGEQYALDLDVTIPVGATQVTLSCYYQAQTEETTATIEASRDAMVAWLWDEVAGGVAYQFQYWGPSNSSLGWHLFTNTASGANAAALAGKNLVLEFYAEVDELRSSEFFIDTCSLKVTVCN